jgi:hypothetical protein
MVAYIQVPTPTRIGHWGSWGGTLQEMQEKSQRLESVTIRHSGAFESISFSYFNEDGQIRTAGPWGSHIAGSKETTVSFFGLFSCAVVLQIILTIRSLDNIFLSFFCYLQFI